MAVADANTAASASPDAARDTANPSSSAATAHSAAASAAAAAAEVIVPSISTDPTLTAASDPPLPPLIEGEGAASTANPPATARPALAVSRQVQISRE